MIIVHIAMYVNDLEAAMDFFISFDDGDRLEIMTKPELAEQLRLDGFEVVSGPCTTGDGYRFLY